MSINMELAVQTAIKQHASWLENSGSVRTPQPRVIVKDGGVSVIRRPFKRKGHWVVRWQGFARLTNPRVENGNIVFLADWR